jgi:hypothetical protein
MSNENPATASNNFMCIPPDHLREDMPTAIDLHSLKNACRSSHSPLYVRIRDEVDGCEVTLPCYAAERVGDGVALVAHRTGRAEA